jgi:hypothetical protein
MIERRIILDNDLWLEWRRKNVNASEVGALFGVHDYLTLAKLVAIKRGIEGLDPDSEDALIRRGNALEDDAADEVSRLEPTWEIEKAIEYFIDTEHRLACTPDFFVRDPARPGRGVLQTKVVSRPVFRSKWDVDTRTPPFFISLQTAVEMMLTDATWGAVGALVLGDYNYDPYIFPIERNRGAEKKLTDASKEFWRAFDAGEEVTIDYERDQRLIALLFPREIPGKIIDLTGDNRIRELLELRAARKEKIDELTTELDKTDAEIKAKMRDAEAALLDGWKLTLKHQHRRAHEVSASDFRVLRATRLTGKDSAA